MTDILRLASNNPSPRPDEDSRPAPRRRLGHHPVRSVISHVILIAAVLVSLYPVLWMLASSLREQGKIFTNSSLFLDSFDFRNYTDGWNALTQPFGTYLLNSTIIVIGCVIGNLLTCSMAAYAFARLKFRFHALAFGTMLLTLMIPIHVVIIPQYTLWAQLHLTNTFVPLILPKFLATDAFFIFLMMQFIRGLPRELDEAAVVDGANKLQVFLRIILPLLTPALAMTAIFTILWTWNDFFSQLVYLTDPSNYTVPVALRGFLDAQGQSSYGGMFAMSIVSILPMILVFTFGQRWLIQGIATTGGKG